MQNSKLKYEDQFKVGDKIRAYDFINVQDHYVEGVVLETGIYRRAKVYIIHCEKDTLPNFHRLGNKVYVPMQTMLEH